MLFLLAPLTLVLAIQDWKSQKVNLWVAILSLVLLAIFVNNAYLAIITFSVLLLYKRIRPGSIQLIDIAFFSAGAGFFALPFFSIYCLITAGILWVLSTIKKTQIPFLVAWWISFWITILIATTKINQTRFGWIIKLL